MSLRTRIALALFAASLTGCAVTTATTSASPALALGNWQITAPTAATLPSFSGELTGSGAALTGIFHANSASACIAPGKPFQLSGAVSGTQLRLTGPALAGGTLSLTGTLAADGKSLTAATYTITGGTCAFASLAAATATAYSPITGTYTGTFTDATNTPVISISANLTQTPASDTSGNFQLSGNATFGPNPCFTSPVSIASSQVTGGSFTLTYTDATTTNSVTASGTFAPSGTALTVTNWTLTGPCGPDSGTGSLSR